MSREERFQRVAQGLDRPQRILIVQDAPFRANIGDHCRLTGEWSGLKAYFHGADIDLWVDSAIAYSVHLGNPNYREVRRANYREEDLSPYDLVIPMVFDEESFLERLPESCAVGSLGPKYYGKRKFYESLLPSAVGVFEEVARQAPSPRGQLFLSAEEQRAAASLEGPIMVIIDETSAPAKHMPEAEHMEMVRFLLGRYRGRALVFEWPDAPKRARYERYLPAELVDRIVFHRTKSLRGDVAVLASPAVRLVFGPDTGMLHLASAVHAGHQTPSPPTMMCYAGAWERADPRWWWKGSLAHCAVILRDGSVEPVGRAVIDEVPGSLGPADQLRAERLIQYYLRWIAPAADRLMA